MDKPKKSVRRRTAGVTIDEVAALAGVSPMTVSRVINQGKVRDVTRERVLRAVRELGYTPNLAASSLAAAQHTRIALIYTNPSGACLRELLVGLLRVASSSALQLVIDYWDNLDAESERKAARALAGRVDGDPAAAPVRIAGRGKRTGQGRHSGGGHRIGSPERRPVLCPHRRFQRRQK